MIPPAGDGSLCQNAAIRGGELKAHGFDHIAVAVHRLSDAVPFVVGELGGRPAKGGQRESFRWRQWRFDGGGRLEVLEPAGPAGAFLHRFLARRGPGVHHVTFHVDDLDVTCHRAQEAGFPVVGRDDSDPRRKEAFLEPKSALGILVQLVETPGSFEVDPASRPAPDLAEPHDLHPGPPGIGLVGLRLLCRDLSRAQALWGDVLSGGIEASEELLQAQWPRSPLRLTVHRASDAEEGPAAIELVCLRPAVLPRAAHPVLGAVFEPVDPDASVTGSASPARPTAEFEERETYLLDADELDG